MFFLKWNILKVILYLHGAGIVLVAAISPQIQTNVFKGVPDNWASSIDYDPFVKIGQKYYFIQTAYKATWYKAAYECRRHNTNLASIESPAEADALNKYLLSKGLRHVFWISGNDLDTDGQYFWYGTGNAITYVPWAANEPSRTDKLEHCLNYRFSDDQYAVNDEHCLELREFLCEARIPTTVAFTIW